MQLIVCSQGLGVDSCIPSCTDRRESGALVDGVDQVVKFTMSTSMSFPAEFALAGHCDILVGGDDVVFAEEDRSIVLQINVRYTWSLCHT